VNEERVAGTYTYTGTREEIVALLREHAAQRDASADYFSAADMGRAADEIERGLRTEFKSFAVYRVEAAESDEEQVSGELLENSSP
jgi:hypothetical protein